MNTILDEMLGKTTTSITTDSRTEIVFVFDDGTRYRMEHIQNCCETVEIDDVIGNLDDLVGSPLLMAEESASGNPPGEERELTGENSSFTWSFYRFATVKGYVTIRWYGESNGCYSEKASITKF